MSQPQDGSGGAPWWASGAEGADGLDEAVDPLTAHRTARAEGPVTPPPPPPPARSDWDIPWEDWDNRDAPPPSDSQRNAWDDAVEGFQAIARFAASRRGDLGGAFGSSGSGGRARPHDETCKACPWCMVLRTLGDSRPDVVAHLEEAMRHMVAAARSVVDAAEHRGGTYENIPLDDEPQP